METTLNSELLDKRSLRQAVRARRDAVHAAYMADPDVYYHKLRTQTVPSIQALIGDQRRCVSGFAPILSEIDCFFVLQQLKHTHQLALPIVVGVNKPLIFRAWDGQASSLVSGKYGLKVPNEDSPLVTPDVSLTSLLSYTPDKYRLGYGYGYYDRTFAEVDCLKIGLCFSQQQIE